MVGPTMKTTPPQVQVENLPTEFSVWQNHTLTLADGSSVTGTHFKYAAKDLKTQFITVGITAGGKQVDHVFYDPSHSKYYYKLPGESRYTELTFENAFYLGDGKVATSMGSGYNIPNVGHNMGGLMCDKWNFLVDGVRAKNIFIATEEKDGNHIGDIFYQTPNGYFRAQDRAKIIYSDNPTTEVPEQHVIDLTQSIVPTILVSPNPVRESASFKFDQPYGEAASVAIYNLLGDKVYSVELQAGQREFVLDAGNWLPGTYYMRIQSPGGEPKIGSFVVQH
ncbi:MAG: T9SS type A sorting domain-containing protein [Candidatus Marsarchaeota archaeon]|nr:T9SS type A sorting domain-containing protein [Candidatus Marsarchaeota archaeon]